jgi:enoyl-CoA hydratase
MSPKKVIIDMSDGIATLTINRPEALNALSRELIEELGDAVRSVNESPEIKVAIITGSGEKAFVAGADIAAMQAMTPGEARELALMAQGVYASIERSPKPFIAAVNGFALGGGCELAMACDMRIASENARFGQPEVKLGITPGFGGTQRLPRLVGKGRAMEIILGGEMITAEEACRIGLVNRVVPLTELLTACRSLAANIAAKGMVAVRLCKEAINNGLEMELSKGIEYEANLFALTFASEDQKEGMKAFLEKRGANFKNR